jgi:GNAT superfamily N-acetyltransferase
LKALDALAARTIARASPLRIGVATSDDERRATYRLRWQCVVESGWAAADYLPEGLEYDEYDDIAVHVVAWANNALVGTCRLAFPEPGRPLPTEAAFGIEIEPRGEVVNCDRLVVAREHRGVVAARAVLAQAWLLTRARGYCVGAGTATPAAAQIFRSLGLRVAVLAGPRMLWGEERFAIRTSPTGPA